MATFTVERTTLVRASCERAFAVAIDDLGALARHVKPHGPIPGVRGAEIVGGDVLAVGTIRRVQLTNGATLNEEIVRFEAPHRVEYRQTTGFGFPFKLLARGADGFYSFEREPDGATRMRWGATIELTTFVVKPFVEIALRRSQLAMMQGFLDGVAAELEG
jgi:hypothetical protein